MPKGKPETGTRKPKAYTIDDYKRAVDNLARIVVRNQRGLAQSYVDAAAKYPEPPAAVALVNNALQNELLQIVLPFEGSDS